MEQTDAWNSANGHRVATSFEHLIGDDNGRGHDPNLQRVPSMTGSRFSPFNWDEFKHLAWQAGSERFVDGEAHSEVVFENFRFAVP